MDARRAREHVADKGDDSEADPGNSTGHACSATEHAASEAVTTPHVQGNAVVQCAPVSERTSQVSGSSEPQQPTHTIGIWQVEFPKQWMEYEPAINADIEQQYHNGGRVAQFRQCRSKKKDWWDDYSIAFDRMEQRNARSGRVRKVRRIERNVPLPQLASMHEDDELTGVWSSAIPQTNRILQSIEGQEQANRRPARVATPPLDRRDWQCKTTPRFTPCGKWMRWDDDACNECGTLRRTPSR